MKIFLMFLCIVLGFIAYAIIGYILVKCTIAFESGVFNEAFGDIVCCDADAAIVGMLWPIIIILMIIARLGKIIIKIGNAISLPIVILGSIMKTAASENEKESKRRLGNEN